MPRSTSEPGPARPRAHEPPSVTPTTPSTAASRAATRRATASAWGSASQSFRVRWDGISTPPRAEARRSDRRPAVARRGGERSPAQEGGAGSGVRPADTGRRASSADDPAALRAHAIPLAGVDPAVPDDDLAPLLERLAGARLVGLGEATHGDHESFQFRSRLVQTLVRRRGLGAVLFEAGPAEMDPFD